MSLEHVRLMGAFGRLVRSFNKLALPKSFTDPWQEIEHLEELQINRELVVEEVRELFEVENLTDAQILKVIESVGTRVTNAYLDNHLQNELDKYYVSRYN